MWFSDTTGLEEQERAKRRQVMEKFQKAPFEEIAAHCESKVIKNKTKKSQKSENNKENTQINSCSLLPGEHAARPARTNLWTHNQVSLLCNKFSHLNMNLDQNTPHQKSLGVTLKVKPRTPDWSPVELVQSALLPASRHVLSSLLKLRLWFHHRGWDCDALKPQSAAVTTAFSSTNRCLVILAQMWLPSRRFTWCAPGCRCVEIFGANVAHEKTRPSVCRLSCVCLTCSFLIASSREHSNSPFAALERVRRLQITCTFPHSHAYITNTAVWNGLSWVPLSTGRLLKGSFRGNYLLCRSPESQHCERDYTRLC